MKPFKQAEPREKALDQCVSTCGSEPLWHGISESLPKLLAEESLYLDVGAESGSVPSLSPCDFLRVIS